MPRTCREHPSAFVAPFLVAQGPLGLWNRTTILFESELPQAHGSHCKPFEIGQDLRNLLELLPCAYTLTLVFSDSVTTLGRKVMEQQGEKVQRLELLKKCFTRAAGCNAQAAESWGRVGLWGVS